MNTRKKAKDEEQRTVFHDSVILPLENDPFLKGAVISSNKSGLFTQPASSQTPPLENTGTHKQERKRKNSF